MKVEHSLRLGVNIDHVATLRNARGGAHPDPLRAAFIAAEAGADGVTAHLREDRRHIRDSDITRLKNECALPLNLEMAATEEMITIAIATRPHAVCIVPEKREERTTEGGLDIISNKAALMRAVPRLKDAGIRVSLFINPDNAQLEAAKEVGAQVVELHTGKYCEDFASEIVTPAKAGVLAKIPASAGMTKRELLKIKEAACYATQIGLECHAGHGLSFDTVQPVAAISQVVELNIGHFLIGEAVFLGLRESIIRMMQLMQEARK